MTYNRCQSLPERIYPMLGELLVLFDAVRGGSARERALAIDLLDKRLQA